MFRKIAEEVQIQKIIAQIARREGITEDEVRSAMQEALQAGLRNPDPAIQAAWRQIPMKGNSPRPEEFIAWPGARFAQKQRVENCFEQLGETFSAFGGGF